MTRPARGGSRPARRTRSAKRLTIRNAGRVKGPPPDWFLIHPWLREAGVPVTSESASQVAAVYGCCRLIVDCLAPAPIAVTEIQPDGKRQTRHDDPVGWTLNYGAPIQRAPDAPTAQAIEEALYWDALIGDGNGYAEIQWDGSGKFFALWPISSSWVTPAADSTGTYYRVQPQSGSGEVRIEPKDMFHLRGPSLKGWIGDSMVYRAAKAIGIAHASQVYSAAYFANGTAISGLLTSDKNITPAQAKDAKARWEEEHGGGPGKAHGVSVLGAGVKYQPINHTAQESMLIESRRFQVQEIARFFGVPTTLLADNEAWTNLSELYLGFYRNCLRAWSERFDAEATRKLMPMRQPWREITHDLTHLTLGSFKDQVEALTKAVGGRAIWTQNEARAVFGKNSVEGGDELDEPTPEPQPSPEPDPMMPKDGPEEVARQAANVFYSQALERHAKRVAKGGKVDESMAKLQIDCDAALAFLSRAGLKGPNGALSKCAEAVLIGQPPADAAALLVGGLEHA